MASLLCSPSARDWASIISSGGKLWAWRAVLCGKAEALRGLSSRQKAIGSSNGRITGLFLQSWALLKPCVIAHLCNSISMPISADPWKRQDSLAALDKMKNWSYFDNDYLSISLVHAPRTISSDYHSRIPLHTKYHTEGKTTGDDCRLYAKQQP